MTSYVGFIQTPIGCVDSRPAKSVDIALKRASELRVDFDGPVSICCRRADIPQPDPTLRKDRIYSDAGLCAGNPGALKINKKHWHTKIAFAYRTRKKK